MVYKEKGSVTSVMTTFDRRGNRSIDSGETHVDTRPGTETLDSPRYGVCTFGDGCGTLGYQLQ